MLAFCANKSQSEQNNSIDDVASWIAPWMGGGTQFLTADAYYGYIALAIYLALQDVESRVLTWGGLRGGISVALALSIPKYVHGEYFLAREAIVAVTYTVVVFSIAVQGLREARRLFLSLFQV